MKKTMIEKAIEKTEKKQRLEESRKQFCHLPQAAQRAYVWVGNTSFPVPLTSAK